MIAQTTKGLQANVAGEDARAVRACLNGESEQFRSLFERHRGAAYGVAISVLGNGEDALDACQEGFLKAFRNLKRYDPRRRFEPWLLRIVRNSALDLYRRRRVRSGEELDPARQRAIAPSGSPEEGVARRELAEELERALAKLSPEHREVFLLRETQNLSYEQIAEIVGVARGTVMSRLFYARQKLRRSLEGWL